MAKIIRVCIGIFTTAFRNKKIQKPFSYVLNIDTDNSQKWVLFNIVSGQITSDALWK